MHCSVRQQSPDRPNSARREKSRNPQRPPINETTFFTPSSLPISHVRAVDPRAGIESPPSSEATPLGIREGLWPYPPASRARQDPKSKISHSGSRFRAPRIHRAAEIQKNFDGPSGRMPALAQGSGGSSGSLDARPPRRPWVAPRPSASSPRLRRFKA